MVDAIAVLDDEAVNYVFADSDEQLDPVFPEEISTDFVNDFTYWK